MRFLLIRFSSLGDVSLITPVIKNIKLNDPHAIIDILTKKRYTPLFENNPDVNMVLNSFSRKFQYDYLIDLHNNLRSNIYKYLFPAKNRLVYNNASYARRIYLHTKHKTDILKKNVIERYLEPLEMIGYKTELLKPRIYVSDQERENVRKLIPDSESYIVISPGAKWETKEWIIENYANLAVRIIRELKYYVVLVGTENDIALSEQIYKGVGLLKSHMLDLTGKTSIRKLISVIDKAKLLVTTDSGPMHIGWSLGKKIITLFGPTVKEFGFQPFSENVIIIEKDMQCRPCSLHGSKKCKFNDKACLQRIEVPEVFNILKALL